jgi:hypothetical protein
MKAASENTGGLLANPTLCLSVKDSIRNFVVNGDQAR